MPLIVKVNPGNVLGKYPDITSPDGLISPPPIETELKETSPLLREKIKAKQRQFRKAVSRKIQRRLRNMKRTPVLMLILIEVFERFAYYGILINFVLFLNKCCGWTMFLSVASVMTFSSISWFMCALTGIMGDSRFGRYNTIVSGFLVYFFGALTLVLVAFLMGYFYLENGQPRDRIDQPWILMILLVALLSICAGEGAVKANLSAFEADQLKRDAPVQENKMLFNCFYWMSNVISLLCLAVVTYIQQMKWCYGFTIGFGIPAFSLTIAFAIFLCCRKHFAIDRPRGTGLRNMWLIMRQAWSRRKAVKVEERELIPRSTCTSESDFSPSGGDWLDMALVAYGGTFMDSEVNELRALKKAVVFCLLLIPYWMIYTQLYSTFILQGLHLKAEYGGFIIPAAWPSLCEIFILLILVPMLERAIYPSLNGCGINVSILGKVILGMFLAAGSAGMAGYVEKEMTNSFFDAGSVNHTASGEKYPVVRDYSIWWQIPQYTLMGMSEVFTSIPGLQMVFTMCPDTPQSVTSAVFNMMISIGSLLSLGILALTAYLWGWYPRAREGALRYYLGNDKVAYYYWLLAVVMVATALLTSIVGYTCDIGPDKNGIKHQVLVNEETSTQGQLSNAGVDSKNNTFVELSS